MATSFPRTLRSIRNDGYHVSLLSLAIAGVILAAWLVWFFIAPLPHYVSSSQISVNRDGTLQVQFPEAALERIKPGQNAQLRQKDTQTDIPAIVSKIDRAETGGTVKIFLLYEEPLKSLPQGEVLIEVEQLTPASMLIRMLGRESSS